MADTLKQIGVLMDRLRDLQANTYEVTEEIQRLIASGDASVETAVAMVAASVTFDDFWRAYPKRTGSNPKQAAREVWNRLKPSPALALSILTALIAQAATWTDPDYIPHARTWLRQRRWEDTVEQPLPAKPVHQQLQPNQLTRRTNEVLAGFGGDGDFAS